MTEVIEELERIELPVVTPRLRRAYADYWHIRFMQNSGLPVDIEQSTTEDAAAAEAIQEVAVRLQQLVEDVGTMVENTALPIEVRERAARAFYRGFSPHILLGNELNEGQKAWPIARLAKSAKGQADRILAAWAASEDPHAGLVAELQRRTKLGPKELAKVIEAVCDGWTLQTPGDDGDYAVSPKVVRRKLTEAVAIPGVVDAVRSWLDASNATDYERRVLHAGAALAADGSRTSSDTLRAILDTASTWSDPVRFHDEQPREWAIAVWATVAPAGSPVAALVDGDATPATKAAKPAKKAQKAAKPAKRAGKAAKPAKRAGKAAKPAKKAAKKAAKPAKKAAKKAAKPAKKAAKPAKKAAKPANRR